MSISNLTNGDINNSYLKLKINDLQAKTLSADLIKSINLNDNFFKADFTCNFDQTDTVVTVPWLTQSVTNAGIASYNGQLNGSGVNALYKFNEDGIYNVSVAINIPAGQLDNANFVRFAFEDLVNPDLCDVVEQFEGHTNANYTISYTYSANIKPILSNNYKCRFLFLQGGQAGTRNVSGCLIITRIK